MASRKVASRKVPPCLLRMAVMRLTAGQLFALALQEKLGAATSASKPGDLRRQVLKVAYQSKSAHAHAWGHVVAAVLTRAQLLDISGKRQERGSQSQAPCGVQPRTKRSNIKSTCGTEPWVI